MLKATARIATTGIIEQGGIEVMITKDAIESIPGQVSGERALPYRVEHNPFCMPMGKVEDAWVERYKDGYAAMARIHIEDSYSKLAHERSGADLVSLDFEGSPKPFLQRKYDNSESKQDIVSVDLANFPEPQDYDAFISDVRLIDNTAASNDSIQRHSLGPEPLLQLVLSEPGLIAALTVGAWAFRRGEKFVRYTVDETLRKLADDISDSLSNKIRTIVKAYRQHTSLDDRMTITKIIIPAELELILLAKLAIHEEWPTIKFSKLVDEIEKYADILQEATSATFVQVGSDSWEFQYCMTRSGKVIGSLECYERTKEIMQRIGPGISIGGYAVYERNSRARRGIEEEQDLGAADACPRD